MPSAYDAFDQLLNLAGRSRPDWATIETRTPAMKTRFRAEEAAAAVLAAIGVEAAELWRSRSGEAQTVRADTREAAAALVSFVHQQFEDPHRAPPSRPDDASGSRGTPAMGFFRTADDRWVFLHPSFPESAARLHALLGSPKDRDAVAAEALKWKALELETAIADAGACGAMARTADEWDASEPGRLLAAAPVVEIVHIGESPPEPSPRLDGAPLAGLRVLDLTRVLAGPTCARTLAQHGADTLHVSSPHLPTTDWFVSDTNPGKRSTFLDLRSTEDHAHLRNLVRGCDVFSQSYRSGAIDRLGFGPAELAMQRPGIICVSINAYGHEGPWRARPGWEQLAQTVTGMATAHGEDFFGGARGPLLQPGAVTDYTTGYLAAFGAMVALRRRAKIGGSYQVRVSLARTAMWVRGLGRAGPERLEAARPHTPEELAEWMIRMPETGFGPLRRLRPPVQLSATPPRWDAPVSRLGAHPPAWSSAL
jgi:crotonobetainyl-CoA:carnitine CoA-transferase CaiB-like acyl-CoA transferase